MSKRNTKDHLLTKGQAIIQAREILGPNARVYALYNPTKCFIDLGPDTVALARGETWEAALAVAGDSPEAKAWGEKGIAEHNALAEAVNSMKATAKKLLGTKFALPLSRSEVKQVRKGLAL
jgi:hypothetical protein